MICFESEPRRMHFWLKFQVVDKMGHGSAPLAIANFCRSEAYSIGPASYVPLFGTHSDEWILRRAAPRNWSFGKLAVYERLGETPSLN